MGYPSRTAGGTCCTERSERPEKRMENRVQAREDPRSSLARPSDHVLHTPYRRRRSRIGQRCAHGALLEAHIKPSVCQSHMGEESRRDPSTALASDRLTNRLTGRDRCKRYLRLRSLVNEITGSPALSADPAATDLRFFRPEKHSSGRAGS